MAKLADIAPKKKQRLIDLVRAAGVDVRDWGNFKGGHKKAGANPKYCYEWAFIQPGKVVVLNLWHTDMEQRNQDIVIHLNLLEPGSAKHPQRKRWLMVQDFVKIANRAKLPIRVIVLDGKMGDKHSPSRVTKRYLDLAIWRVTSYNSSTGNCTLTRSPTHYVDQFSIPQEATPKPERRAFSGHAFIRNAIVRSNVLGRANGRCQWCGKAGFAMPDGRIYLETHHVVSLSEGGDDSEDNVAALCPNHHREAHHGKGRAKMREQLLQRLKRAWR